MPFLLINGKMAREGSFFNGQPEITEDFQGQDSGWFIPPFSRGLIICRETVGAKASCSCRTPVPYASPLHDFSDKPPRPQNI